MKTFSYCLILFILTRLWFFGMALLLNQQAHLGLHAETLFIQQDGKWYLDIIWHGYDKVPKPWDFGRANYVFFPLLPLLIKAVMVLTHLPPAIAGQVLTNGFFLLALCLFYRLLEEEFNAKAARLGILLLALSPYNIYFMSIYTESLTLALTLGCWLAARHRQWWVLGILGFLVSACHPNGVLIFIFALWFVAEDDRQQHNGVWQYLPVLLIPFGLLSYMLYLHFHMGDALSFVHDQHYWSKRTGWQFHGFWYELIERIKQEPYNFVVYILSLLLSAFLAWRRFYKEALFIPLMTLPALWSGSFSSLARYSATCFSFYLALTLLLQDLKAKRNVLFTMSMIILCFLVFFMEIVLMHLYLAHSSWVY